jgi:hypothetical protein
MASLRDGPPWYTLWISRDGLSWDRLPGLPVPGGYISPSIAAYAGGMAIGNGDRVTVVTLDR